MELIGKGILLGLGLSILVGPLVFALVQASLEYGKKAGIAVGLGIWVSDLLFILGVFFGVSYIMEWVNWEGFELTVGAIGAVILMGMGIGLYFSKPPNLKTMQQSADAILNVDDDGNPNTVPYRLYFLQGFAINTFNPFTVIFWTSVSTETVAKAGLGSGQALLFYSSILIMIILSDSLKVYFANKVKPLLKVENIVKMRKITGVMLFIFGIVLLIRVI